MLSHLLSILDKEESVSVNLHKDKKGASKIILTARVDFDPDETDESVRQLRAALARPLVVRLDQGEDPDTVLRDAIASFSAEQKAGRDTLKEYKADQVASRAAVKAVAATKSADCKGKKAPEASKETQAPEKAEKSNPAPAPEAAPDANPASLF